MICMSSLRFIKYTIRHWISDTGLKWREDNVVREPVCRQNIVAHVLIVILYIIESRKKYIFIKNKIILNQIICCVYETPYLCFF